MSDEPKTVGKTVGKTVDSFGSDSARHLNLIQDARRNLSRARAKHEYHKALAKEAKADVEAAIERLLSAVDDRDEDTPLLDGMPAQAPSKDAEAWRATPIDQLEIPAAVMQKLIDAEMETLGKLADHGQSGKGWIAIPGIGEASGEKIDKALDRYWQDHPQPDPDEAAGDADAAAA